MANKLKERKFFTSTPIDIKLPNLIDVQLESYERFLSEGLKDLFSEITPINDFTGKKLELHFLDYSVGDPKYDENLSKNKNVSFEAPIRVQVQLINKISGEVKEQDVFLGNIPLMTNRGTFIINGVERAVVNQITRSPGIYFLKNDDGFFTAKIIPNRGAWLELETSKKGIINVKIDKKRKIPVTALLRAFGHGSNKDILSLFDDIRSTDDITSDQLLLTLEKDPTSNMDEGLQAVYKRLRPGDLATSENAKQLIDTIFFDFRRYDMGRVGRYKINKKFNLDVENVKENRVFSVSDLVLAVKELVRLNNGIGYPDDIDHLGNRRIRSVGELVQNKFRVGLLRTERIAKDRMTVLELDTVVPTQLINARPITAAMREFFASSQLSQFMDQTNPLSEIDHKRRLSAMGPGGLTRERASFDVRDVHPTHYGRICPIATPEGPNIGLVVHLSTYAKVNEYGFIETPYAKVGHFVKNDGVSAVGRESDAEIKDAKKKVVVKDHEVMTEKHVAALKKIKDLKEIPVIPFITEDIEYYTADDEIAFIIADANTEIDEKKQFKGKRIAARVGKTGEASVQHYKDITHMDISPKQIVSVSTSLIPFLEHDEGARALMGSNMQRQAVPIVNPEAPIVGTGMEGIVAKNSGQILLAEDNGEVAYVDALEIRILTSKGDKKVYKLQNFIRSNQATCLHQKPIVEKGQKVKKGDPLTDGASVSNGELALGRNLLCAFVSWRGWNYEDAIIISDNVVREGMFSSIHIEDYVVDVRDTKLGPETVTRDIPNVGEDKLKDLDEDGIIRIGAEVKEGDILAGKITPKGETELTPEEKLLRAIFGEKARDVKDTSMRLPGGQHGKVVGVKVYTRENGDELSTGVNKQVKVMVAQIRRLSIGDKMAGRHGNKGVVSRIVPQEDMPYLEDGTPVDIVLNPLGVVSRMNLGQILETHLGWAGKKLGINIATPVLNGVPEGKIQDLLEEAGLPKDGRVQLFDGMTGEKFEQLSTVGQIYMMKLIHLVDDKIHARSIGPYSLVTQQPLGGKAQHGGQRFGEMEVWALEAYGVAHFLQEIITIKSDDVYGRSKAYESIIKQEDIRTPRLPESFNVLVRELRSLGLEVELLKEEEIQEVEQKNILEAVAEPAILEEDLVEAAAQDGTPEAVTTAKTDEEKLEGTLENMDDEVLVKDDKPTEDFN